MGLLVEGKWQDQWYDTASSGGRFVRQESQFRHWISSDAGSEFQPEPGRYLLYIARVCPWAHRTVLVRAQKGLESVIDVAVTSPAMGEEGWYFGDEPGVIPDPEIAARHVHQIYTAAEPQYTGRVTVPVLWDRQRKTIVNNESADIVRMLNSAFGKLAQNPVDLYPEPLRAEIDALNAKIYDAVNNGVYKCGFATSQAAYDEAFDALFATLDELEARLSRNRYLMGGQLTEADWRLFPTLVRFDVAYYGNFKCNGRHLYEYPNLWGYTRELYQMPGVAETIDFDHIRKGYYHLPQTNPSGIVPRGPIPDFAAPHDRAQLPVAD